MAAPSNNLPGVNVTLNDLGLRLSPPADGTKVTLIGIATNPILPINEPLQVVSSTTAIDAFNFADNIAVFTGGAGNKWPSDLSLAVEEAFAAGATTVEVMVSALRTGQAAIDNYHPRQAYNDLSGTYAALLNTPVDIVVPVGVYLDSTEGSNASGSFNYGKQLANFCYQATKTANSAIGVIAMSPVLYRESQIRQISPTLTVGPFGSYSGSFTGAENWRFDTPSLSSVNGWVNWLDLTENQLYMTGAAPSGSYSGWWYTNSMLKSYMFGSELAAGTTDTVDATYLTDWQAAEEDGTNAIDSKGNKVDAGAYISVVAAPLRGFSSQARRLASRKGVVVAGNFHNTGGAAAYAGLITALIPHYGTTNRVVPDIGPARILGRVQADKLVGRRLATFLLREPGFVVARGVTGARNAGRYARSDYVSLNTVRLVHAIVDLVRDEAEKYIGVPANPQTRGALEQSISSRLNELKEQGAVLDADFSLTATPEQNVLGEADINLTIVPAHELVKLNLTVNLAQTLS